MTLRRTGILIFVILLGVAGYAACSVTPGLYHLAQLCVGSPTYSEIKRKREDLLAVFLLGAGVAVPETQNAYGYGVECEKQGLSNDWVCKFPLKKEQAEHLTRSLSLERVKDDATGLAFGLALGECCAADDVFCRAVPHSQLYTMRHGKKEPVTHLALAESATAYSIPEIFTRFANADQLGRMVINDSKGFACVNLYEAGD